MNRRDFLRLLGAGAFGIGALVFGIPPIGCSNNSDSSKTVVASNGINYQIQDGVISQATKGDGQIKLGVMAVTFTLTSKILNFLQIS